MEKDKQTLTLNIKVKVSQNNSPYLKKLLTVLNDDDLGDYFIRFLQRHTLNELNNKEDYLENWNYQMIKNIVNELSKKDEILKQDILESLISDEQWFENLK